MKRKVSSSVIRKAVKRSHPNLRFSKNVDALIYLDCILFLKALAQEATAEARASRQHTIQEGHVHAVAERVLQEFKG